MLSEELIKQIFFQSDKPRKDALLADEVDIVQFAENVLAVARIEIAKQEHARCVAMVKDMNRVVGETLEKYSPR